MKQFTIDQNGNVVEANSVSLFKVRAKNKTEASTKFMKRLFHALSNYGPTLHFKGAAWLMTYPNIYDDGGMVCADCGTIPETAGRVNSKCSSVYKTTAEAVEKSSFEWYAKQAAENLKKEHGILD